MGQNHYLNFFIKENLKVQCGRFNYCPSVLVPNPSPDLYGRHTLLCPTVIGLAIRFALANGMLEEMMVCQFRARPLALLVASNHRHKKSIPLVTTGHRRRTNMWRWPGLHHGFEPRPAKPRSHHCTPENP